jgi:hypothetical protein
MFMLMVMLMLMVVVVLLWVVAMIANMIMIMQTNGFVIQSFTHFAVQTNATAHLYRLVL